MLQHPDYNIEQEIGQGGMATVYRAHDRVFKCPVAIKILNKEFLHNEHVRSRFLDEARKIYRMNHPNIIRVTRIIEEDEGVAFVMEHINGVTLKEYIEEHGKLGNDEIVRLMVQMLDALQYVHQQGLVHRDVKPSNFMIDSGGMLKLLDFGIAKNNNPGSAEYTQTAAASQMGTPMYMSPEQVNEAKSVTAQSDIYSLGVVLWFMVMGEKPYNSNSLSTFQLLSKIVHEQLRDTGSIFQPIISRCTQKNLDERYSDCNQVKSDLLALDPLAISQRSPKSVNLKLADKGKKNLSDDSTRVVFFPEDKKQQPPATGFFANKRNRILAAAIGLVLFVILTGLMFLSGKKEPSTPELTKAPEEPINTSAPVSADSIINTITPTIDVPASPENNLPVAVTKPAGSKRLKETKISDSKIKVAPSEPATVEKPEEHEKATTDRPTPVPDVSDHPANEAEPPKKKKFFERVGDGIKKVFKKKNKE